MSGVCPTDCNIGLSLEEKQALLRVQCAIKLKGAPIYVKVEDSETIERDEFNSIKKRATTTTKTVYAKPIVFSPGQKDKDRNGIRENVQVMITTPMQCWIDNGFSEKDLSELDSIRAEVVLRGQTYEIRDKSFSDQIGSTFLYVVLGLNRK